ncbi:hypothetical protein CEUSTIGMA_g1981.t1 [Chlamydomonas eustigma]|uniref:Uncharacterized protein n=1 Tax=Chlamydomonas eustigma TaxID=1157962 RepID=A0A250WV87_9CHLO|nr:hypothetical protein CEUSTIGMA_g1981.t1 [Chlamydomonas eustigma]|eukprot:GAX74532.1 hypothetical protein CEUSTIGMA_g1981.t1 [Chlamydomonas eustigma]
MESLLNVSGIDKKIWLVKVPTSVAQVWRPLCEQSMRSTAIDEDDDKAVELGTLSLPMQAGASEDITLSLKGAEGKGLPSTFRMNRIPPDRRTFMTAVSYKASEPTDGGDWSQSRLEGTVDSVFNLMPIHRVDDKGQVEIDEAYRKLTKDRSIKASIKTKGVMVYEDTRENRVATLATNKAVLDLKRRAETQRLNKLENKRTRKDKKELELELFTLFERMPYWTFTHLQRETNQPAQYLKEVLGQIAVQCKAGPNKDLYGLKAEYKEAGAAQEDS